jgi:eukaryotic-like serine/threonine-protein kinase
VSETTPTTPVPPTPDNHPAKTDRPVFEPSSGPSQLVDQRLGPFEVQELIGRGGMGVVLGGVHVQQRVPVAIKVICDSASVSPKMRRRLRKEVQAVAGLNHPGIVKVFDYGEIDRCGELGLAGAVTRGTPYYVMERTRPGTLDEVAGRLDWPQIRTILSNLLDALAHAHAGGVIHRDIKPDNILLADWGGRLIPKLADFGIAYAIEGGSPNAHCVGTPRYMAPEQINEAWRTHGPWSDLYALGCVAFELVCGHELFDGDSIVQIYEAHFRDRHPRLDSSAPVPAAFQAWLDKMLERDRKRRFQTAADAARALAQIDDGDVQPTPSDQPPTQHFAALTPVLDPLLSRSRRDASDALPSSLDPALDQLPKSWPRPSVQPMSIRIVGAGLGLYGLRATPLVGREAELDRMWRTLRAVESSGRHQALVVRGPQGCGKTRLVEWFVQRLRELGAATVLRTTHTADGGHGDGLTAMLERHFRTLGSNARHTENVVRRTMAQAGLESDYEWKMMTRMLRPFPDDELESTAVHIASPSQRYAVISRYLRQLATDRPVVVWCDDAHFGGDTLEFARFMQRLPQEDAGRVLLIVSASDDGLTEHPEEAKLLAQLLERPRAEELVLEPLDNVEHERLVEELLLLEGDLAREVIRRTSGNPLFAFELIGDWVERGVLEVGERGFVLRDGVQPAIPDRLHDVWVQRLEALLADFGEDARLALELAAALGQTVRRVEWEAACDLAGVYLDDSLGGELAERRFAKPTEHGWTFAHAIVRESLERIARDSGRWITHRRTCATMLESIYDLRKPRVAERFGHYSMSAYQFERAHAALFDSAKWRRARGEYRKAQQLVSACIRCLEQMDAPDDDVRWGDVWVLRSRTFLNSGRSRDAHRWARRAVDAAERHSWDDVQLQAMTWLALAKQWMGKEDAVDHLRRAHELLVDGPPQQRLLGIYSSLAHGLQRLERFEDAEQLLESDMEAARQDQNTRALANTHYLRCRAAFFQQNWDMAIERGQDALALFEELGHLPGAVGCNEVLAEIHRVTGEIDVAEELYRRCIDLQQRIGAPTAISETNLANILVHRGRADEAERLFMRAADAFEASGRRMFYTVALAGKLACASAQRWWSTIRERLEPVADFVENSNAAERDLAELLEFAGDRLHEAGQFRDAVEVYKLAEQQWRLLDQPSRAEAVEAKLSRWS